MALQKKYFYQFKQIGTDDINIVELWQDTTDTLVAEEVTGMASPFIVELSDLDNKFQVVIGKGCEVRLLSETDRKFLTGLYHIDPVEFQVRHYINGTLNYLGYLNSEMYQESFSDEFNYGISVTGNDGFALADRFTFLDETEANYTGIKSKFELLMICLQRIGLPYSEVRISLATTFTGYSGDSNSSILHESYIDCANFYDEDDYPMTIREVIESILAPYGAHVWTEGSIVYITDVHTKASGGNVTFKRFDYDLYWALQTGTVVWSLSYSTPLNYDTILDEDGTAYIADIVINIDKIVQDIGYAGTGQSIELSGGVNKQVVSYSPYPYKYELDESIADTSEFSTIPSSWSTKDGYFYKTISGNENWDNYSPSTFQISYDDNNEDSADLYLRFETLQTNQKIAELIINPVIGASNPIFVDDPGTRDGIKLYDGVGLKIKHDILIKSKNNPYSETESASNFFLANVDAVIKIGNTQIGSKLYATNGDKTTNIANSFFSSEHIYKIQNTTASNFKNIYGEITIEIWSDVVSSKTTSQISQPILELNDTDIKEIWIRNISAEIVNLISDELNEDDKEYIGNLTRLYKEEGEKIELKCGTDARFSDKAKIMRSDGTYNYSIIEWTRASNTAKIEELLLVSASSNYQRGFYNLNNFRLRQEFSFMNLFSDNNIADRVFMLKSAKFDYEMNDVECSLIEISPDTLTIDKTELSVPRRTRNGRIYNAKSL